MSKKKEKNMKLYNEKRKTFSVLFIFLFLVLTLVSLIVIGMLVWGLLTSLKSKADFTTDGNVLGLPNISKSFNELCKLSNYTTVFQKFNFEYEVSYIVLGSSKKVSYSGNVQFIHLLLNSIIYSVGGSLVLTLMPAIVAFLCAKYDYVLSKIMFTVFTIMLCMPIIGSYPSAVTFLRNTMLYDSMIGNFLMKAGGSGMYFFVFYAFFKGQSETFREAAEIDGASQLRIMFRVYFPMAKKVILTVFLIQFVALWNDYQTVNLYLPGNPTLSYGVYELTKNGKTTGIPEVFKTVPIKVSASMLVVIPVTIIFIIFKDKLMGDISLGGLKE